VKVRRRDLDNTGAIYIRVPGGYGDNLMATAVVEGLKRQYPDLQIFILTKRMDIFKNNPHVSMCYNTRAVLKKNSSLLEKAVTISYPPYGTLRALSVKRHYIDYMYDDLPLEVAKRCYRPQIYLTEREINYRRRHFEKSARPLVAISPYGGFTSRIQNKFYPVEKWRRIVDGLVKTGFNIVQLGRKKEGPVISGAADWRNIGYRRSAAVLLHCDALVTHPGGFMHLATALSVPCVMLFAGAEDPKVSGYCDNLNLTAGLECSPCWLEKPCESRRCVEVVSPEVVVERTIELVGSPRNAAKPDWRLQNYVRAGSLPPD